MVDAAVLLVSELATNAIVHAQSPVQVGLDSVDEPSRIGVEMNDDSPQPPRVLSPDPRAESGRGMLLTGELAYR